MPTRLLIPTDTLNDSTNLDGCRDDGMAGCNSALANGCFVLDHVPYSTRHMLSKLKTSPVPKKLDTLIQCM